MPVIRNAPGILAVILAVSVAVASHDVTVCWAGHRGLAAGVSAGYHAATTSQTVFPALNVTPRVLGVASNVSVAHGIASGLLAEVGRCTVLLGPGWSSLASSLNVLVDAPLWVGWSNTASELSDTNKYPSFNRVIPTDQATAGRIATFLAHNKWTVVNTLCTDSDYGRSFVQGFSEGLVGSAVRLGVGRCFNEKVTPRVIEAYLREMKTAESRVIVAGLEGSMFDTVVDTVVALGMQADFTFIFGEYACTSDSTLWLKLPGSFCPGFATNASMISAFEATYHRRTNRQALEAVWERMGEVSTGYPAQNRTTTTLDAFAIDATMFALHVVDKYYKQFPAVPDQLQPPVAALRAVARSNTTVWHGITGVIHLSANGDRPVADTAIYNVFKASPTAPAASHVALRIDADNVVAVEATPYYSNGGLLANAPTHLSDAALAGAPPASRTTLFTVVGIAAGLTVVVFVWALVYAVVRYQRLQRYPRDATKPYTVMFVSVKNEAVLRDAFGADTAHNVCRRVEKLVTNAADRHGCVVARRLEAHFMVVSRDPSAMVHAAATFLQAHEHEDWTSVLGARIYGAGRRQNSATASEVSTIVEYKQSNSNDTSPQGSTGHGAKYAVLCTDRVVVSVGMAHGSGRIDVGQDDFDMRYTGHTVDEAASLTDVALSSQVLALGAVISALPELQQAELDYTDVTRPSWSFSAPVFALTVPGVVQQVREVAEISDDAGTPVVGALTSALEEATGGLAQRSVAVAAIVVPLLDSRTALLSDAHAVQSAVAAAAKEEKARVIAAHGGTILVAVNAAGPPVSQAVLRATTVAMNATNAVSALGHAAFGGVDCAAAAVGDVDAAKTVTCSAAVQRATAASTLAARAATKDKDETGSVFVTAQCSSDLSLHFSLPVADVIAWPAVGTAPSDALRPSMLFAPEWRSTEQADDEWMYQLRSAEGKDPDRDATAAVRALCEGDFSKAEAMVAHPTVATLLAAVKEMPPSSPASKVAAYASKRCNVATAAFPLL